MRKLLIRTALYANTKIKDMLGMGGYACFGVTPGMFEEADFSENDLRENAALMARFGRTSDLDVRSINWFMGYVGERSYAGVRTILRFMDYFGRSKRVLNRIIVLDKPDADPDQLRANVSRQFPPLQNYEVAVVKGRNLDAIPACDAAIATFWTTACQLLRFNKTLGKFYFMQDYEPLLYPAGPVSAMAEAACRFGFYGIMNTRGLWEFFRQQYPGPSTYFTPALDTDVFYPPASRNSDGKFRLFFYGRPGINRNAYEIGAFAIQRLKKRWGDRLEVYTAGSPFEPAARSGKTPVIENLGFMPYAKTGDLYRTCDAGLVLMMTKHCSYIPLELMGCGAAVVTNRNDTNYWLYRHEENCLLSEPMATCVADAISRLIENPELTRRLSANAIATVSEFSWEEGMEKIFNFMCRRGGADVGVEQLAARPVAASAVVHGAAADRRQDADAIGGD